MDMFDEVLQTSTSNSCSKQSMASETVQCVNFEESKLKFY